MNLIYRILLAVSMIFTGIGAITAQIPKWTVRPSYESIEPLSNGFYKVKSNGSSTLLDKDLQVIISGADSITPFVNGAALTVSRNAKGLYRIISIVKEDKTVLPVYEEIYLSHYPFFSEGLLPVFNKKEKGGYMDMNAKVAIPFKYTNVHPFSHGLASVSKGKNIFQSVKDIGKNSQDKVSYIDYNGNELNISKDVGEITFGSTFKDGEALVINKSNQYCFISSDGKLKRIDPGVVFTFDHMYRLGEEEEDSGSSPLKTGEITTFSRNGKVGFKKGSKIILTPQFVDAAIFEGGKAAVFNGENFGVIEFVAGAPVVKTYLNKGGDREKSMDFNVSLPQEYEGSEIEIITIDDSDILFSKNSGKIDSNGNASVTLNVPSGEWTAKLFCEGLEIWSDEQKTPASRERESRHHSSSKRNNKKEEQSGELSFSFSSNQATANSKDQASVTITVVNTTGRKIKDKVKMSGASPSSKTIEIPAGGKAQITATFSNVKKAEHRTVSISIAGFSASKRINLTPFFNF